MAMAIPFKHVTDDAMLDRIARQVAEYRWPRTPAGASWPQGADPATMRYIVQRWRDGFDWRAQEARLNERPQFQASVADLRLHFVHQRAAAKAERLPVLLMHGWPGCYLEYLDVADRLVAAGHDAVVVSLPGAGHSDAPEQAMGPRAMAGLMHRLMTEVLGCPRYLAHGADWGSLIAGWLGFEHPQACAGAHMTMVSPRFVAGAATAPQEQQWLAAFRERFEDDGAYFRLQTSRPLTAGYLLNDNPVGLLAWMLEKFAAWGDPLEAGQPAAFQTPERADRLLRNVMLYLVTGSAATSTWIYRGLTTEGPPGYPGGQRVEVPVAIAATRDPMFQLPPRSLVEKAYRVTRWTELAGGGHFPGYEVPDALGEDIRAFAAGL
ncbi:epoxide hydrolase [Hydrogenophaga sp. SNF1]|nr:MULTISPECIES: epoxide hydrolase family protein [Hydrogenophaga]WQB83315.1 epoxide hydrolase [Hydrogenophaga sp. SNF1]